MKKLHLLIFLLAVLVVGSCFMGSLCPPEPDYVNIKFKEDLASTGSNDPFTIEREFSLSESRDFRDNVDESDGVVFIRLSFATDSCSAGLHSLRFYVIFYGHDLTTVIWDAVIDDWQAEDYIKSPYEIMLTKEQKDAFNNALIDYKQKNNFKIALKVEGVADNDGAPFSLYGRAELIFELRVN